MKLLKYAYFCLFALKMSIACGGELEERELQTQKLVKAYFAAEKVALNTAELTAAVDLSSSATSAALDAFKANLEQAKDFAKQGILAIETKPEQDFAATSTMARLTLAKSSLSRLQLSLLRSGQLSDDAKSIITKMVQTISALTSVPVP